MCARVKVPVSSQIAQTRPNLTVNTLNAGNPNIDTTSSRPAGLPASSKQGTTISDCMTLIELQCTSVKN